MLIPALFLDVDMDIDLLISLLEKHCPFSKMFNYSLQVLTAKFNRHPPFTCVTDVKLKGKHFPGSIGSGDVI